MVAQIIPAIPGPRKRSIPRTIEFCLEARLDDTLVTRFNAGDQTAFVEIVTRYRGRMFALAFRYLRNHSDAEEIAQDTFIRAYRGLARFRGDSSLASWLHRITFNLSCNRYWHSERRHCSDTRAFDCAYGNDSNATFADVIASDTPDPARTAANSEFFAQVNACVGKLKEQQRDILTRRSLLDHSYDEIAEGLHINPGTVKSRLARARKSLRRLLAESDAEFQPASSPAHPWLESNRAADYLGATQG